MKAPPPLPEDQLPKKTRPAPDPKTTQYRRGKAYVEIGETVEHENAPPARPKVAVVDEYTKEYLRRAGYDITDSAEGADFTLRGNVQTVFAGEIKFRGEVIAWRYVAAAAIDILDASGNTVEQILIDETEREGINGPSTPLDLRRLIAKKLHDELFMRGKTFRHAKAVELIGKLVVDPFESEDDEPPTGEDIVRQLADIGAPAIPYILEALTDTRTVLVEMDYPGLVELDALKVFHVADKALEEYFQKVSRMDLETPTRLRYLITRGWENEWRRFCPPFRESPQHKKRLELERQRRKARNAADAAQAKAASTADADGASP